MSKLKDKIYCCSLSTTNHRFRDIQTEINCSKDILYANHSDHNMGRRYIYYIVISIVGIVFAVYFYNTQINRPEFGLEVDPIKDTTDMAGNQYRIRLTNIGLKANYWDNCCTRKKRYTELAFSGSWSIILVLSKARHHSKHSKCHN